MGMQGDRSASDVSQESIKTIVSQGKKMAMEERLDRVTDIDLSVQLKEENDGGDEDPVSDFRDKNESPLQTKDDETEDAKNYKENHDSYYHDKFASLRVSTPRCSPIDGQMKIESLRIEMCRLKEENDTLRKDFARIFSNYNNLKMDLFRVMQQKQEDNAQLREQDLQRGEDESQLVALSLWTNPSAKGSKEETTSSAESGKLRLNENQGRPMDWGPVKNLKGLNLTLDLKDEETSPDSVDGTLSPSRTNSTPTRSGCGLRKTDTVQGQTYLSPKNSSLVKHEGASWTPNKTMKTSQDTSKNEETPPPVTKARVSVRARCETQTVNPLI